MSWEKKQWVYNLLISQRFYSFIYISETYETFPFRERNACWSHLVSFRLDFLEKALGNVGGCDGTDTRQGDYETAVSAHPINLGD